MKKIEELTLSEIVTSKPEAAALFENYSLDFCCRGKQKLAQALSNDSMKLAEVTEKLEELFAKQLPVDNNFNSYSLTQLVDHILEKHHRYVKENLPLIQQHLEKVAMKHGETFPYMKEVASLFNRIKIDFEQHMMKEEVILFPRIKLLEQIVESGKLTNQYGSILAPIHVMEAEHETAGRIMEEIKKLTSSYTPPDSACITFRLSLDELKIFEMDLHQHVHLENNILFPKAMLLEEKRSGIQAN